MNHVYAYIRVSTVKQGEKGSSLTEQRIAIEGHAKRHNLHIVEWFEEKETAAKRGRALFEKMMKQLTQGKASGVIIHKIDRGARNLRDWADIGALVDKGIEVHFAHESLDMQSRGGRLAADIQAVVAADYIRNLRDEVRKGFQGRLRQGLYPLPAPIGYLDQGKGQVKIHDPIKAPLIERAFSLYASGNYTLLTLVDELYRLGLRNRRGKRVTRTRLSIILNNEFYVGIIHIRKTGERHLGAHEPIVKKEVFDRVQNTLRGRTNAVGYKHSFTYRRSLTCVHCSHRLTAERQKGHIYYRCQTRTCPKTCLREELIDRSVDDALGRLRMAPDDLHELKSEFDHLEKEKAYTYDDQIQGARLRLAAIDDRRNHLTDAYIDRTISKEVFEERNARLLHDRASAIEELEKIQSSPNLFRKRKEKFLELLSSLSSNENHENREEKRDRLKEVTSNLSIDQKTLTPTYRIPFNMVAMYIESTYGGPHRDVPRTFSSDIRSLAKQLLCFFNS
jgi:DNA invertase Pin-like site-specific DNA recombinase